MRDMTMRKQINIANMQSVCSNELWVWSLTFGAKSNQIDKKLK